MAGILTAAVTAIGITIVLVTSSRTAPDSVAVAPVPIPPPRTADLDEAVRLAGAELISYRYAYGINQHTSRSVSYPTNPPTNGPHAFSWTQDGNYAGHSPPPTGEVVHAQEHGRVVLQYRPGLPRRALAQLASLYEESPEHVLLVENATNMPCEVAATAWGHGVLCPRFTERSLDALRAFRDAFRDRGPESVA